MAGVALITNPRSRANLRRPQLADTLRALLGSEVHVAAPEGLTAMAEQLGRWHDADVRLLAIHGGDGTLHRVVTALIDTWRDRPLPRLALLPGGTMNIVANSLGQRGRVEQLAPTLLQSDLTGRDVWTLRIEGTAGVHYGFLWGNGIIGRFLEVYYEGSEPTPAKAAWILGRGALSAPFGGAAIKRLTRPFRGRLQVDHEDWGAGPWTAIAAGTVEQLGLGFRAFHLAPRHPGQLHAIGIGSGVAALAWDLQRIYRGRGPSGAGNREAPARRIALESDETIGYMIDGDFHTSEGRLTVEVGPPRHIVDLNR